MVDDYKETLVSGHSGAVAHLIHSGRDSVHKICSSTSQKKNYSMERRGARKVPTLAGFVCESDRVCVRMCLEARV